MDNFTLINGFRQIPDPIWEELKIKVNQDRAILRELVKIKNVPISNSLKLRKLNEIITQFENNNPKKKK